MQNPPEARKISYLACLGVMLPTDPPLLLQVQVLLKIVEQICTWHCTSCEEVGAHPAFFEIIRGSLMCKYMHK